MKKISTLALVAILASSVAACDDKTNTSTKSADLPEKSESPRIGQRDVYNTLEDCVADWGDTELCQQEMKAAREHAEKMAAAQAHSGGGTVVPMIFWGPTYYGSERSVTHNGVTRTPTTSTATRTANIWNSPNGARTISYAPPAKVVSTPSGIKTTVSPSSFTSVSRGGFGATGASFGSSGG
jgi:uncharacterized protein YgiB involved in biofilm formation